MEQATTTTTGHQHQHQHAGNADGDGGGAGGGGGGGRRRRNPDAAAAATAAAAAPGTADGQQPRRGGRGGGGRGRGRGRGGAAGGGASAAGPAGEGEAPADGASRGGGGGGGRRRGGGRPPRDAPAPEAGGADGAAMGPVEATEGAAEPRRGGRGGRRGGRGGGRNAQAQPDASEPTTAAPQDDNNSSSVGEAGGRRGGRGGGRQRSARGGARGGGRATAGVDATGTSAEGMPAGAGGDETKEAPKPEQPRRRGRHANPTFMLNVAEDANLLSERLAAGLAAETYECAICFCPVERADPVWSCESCWSVLHLQCVREWRNKSVTPLSSAWRCPGCQAETDQVPKYRCFCGKQRSPDVDTYLIPHSCGAVCGRKRDRGCPHRCQAACHPGPCPPCGAMGPLRTCGCGRTSYRLRCGAVDDVAKSGCGSVCRKRLPCGNPSHVCPKPCHVGSCGDCQETEKQWCYCGRVIEDGRRCGQGTLRERSRYIKRGDGSDDIEAPLTTVLDDDTLQQVVVGVEIELYGSTGAWPTQDTTDSLALEALLEELKAQDQEHEHDAAALKHGHASHSHVPRPAPLAAAVSAELIIPGKTDRFLAVVADDRPYGRFSCNARCNAWLDCGWHRCQEACHGGDCSSCPWTPAALQWCPCGAKPLAELSPVERTSCIDPVPTCGGVCGKTLACHTHKCPLKCHVGPCAPCTQLVTVNCRCNCSWSTFKCGDLVPLITGSTASGQLEVPRASAAGSSGGSAGAAAGGAAGGSAVEADGPLVNVIIRDDGTLYFLCRRECRRWLQCGKHRCHRYCCPWSSDAGAALANVTLAGGIGAAADAGPGQGPGHMCTRVCNKPQTCGRHNCSSFCHLGHCPPCTVVSHAPLVCRCGHTVVQPPILCGTLPPVCHQVCSVPRDCGHPHPAWHTCHYGPCPPCQTLVSRLCMGGHETRHSVPCSVTEVSCGKPCGKPLSCGTHKCTRICHSGPCQPDAIVFSDGRRVSCGQQCGAPRQRCSHKCMAVCHPGEECPQVPCNEKIKVLCACGRLSTVDECLIGAAPTPEVLELEARLAARRAPCDDICESRSRARGFAEALGIVTSSTQSHLPAGLVTGHVGQCPYNEAMLAMARDYPQFVQRVETRLSQFIRDASATSCTFPPMVAAQRAFIHDLASLYHLNSESHDVEPKRYSRLTKPAGWGSASGGALIVPSMTVMEALKVYGTRAATVALKAHPREPTMADMGSDKAGTIIHLMGLRRSTSEDSVKDALARLVDPRTFWIERLDDHNCLVHFNMVERARRFMTTLADGGSSHVPYKARWWGVGVEAYMSPSSREASSAASRPGVAAGAAAAPHGAASGTAAPARNAWSAGPPKATAPAASPAPAPAPSSGAGGRSTWGAGVARDAWDDDAPASAATTITAPVPIIRMPSNSWNALDDSEDD